MLMTEKVVVTGGAGFIGSHLVERLVKENFEVTVFDNFSTGFMQNLEKVKNEVKILKGDIRNFNEINNAVKDSKFVFHMAALSYVGESIKIPEAYNSVNIGGTLNVLKACHENSVERFLFPSTCIIYGEPEHDPTPETDPFKPNSPYGFTKVMGEFYAKFFNDVKGLPTICLRIFNAYGPRMKNRVISIFAEQILQGKAPSINGDGTQERDFVFVSDIVKGFIKAAKAPKNMDGKSFNIGTGESTTLNELVMKINELLETNVPLNHKENVATEIQKIIANTSLSKQALGFTAKTDFNSGMKKTIQTLKEEFKKK